MASAPARKAGAEALLPHLTERAHNHDIPIAATLRQYDTAADLVELTVSEVGL